MARNWSQLAFDFVFRMEDGSEIETRSSVADAIRWEKNHGGKSFVEDTPATTDLVWLGWAAGKRAGAITDDFELFASRLADFAAEPVKWPTSTTDGLDPTQQAQ